jgi:hypothetical protein
MIAVAATLALAIPARAQSTNQSEPNGLTTVFRNISVIPMDTERVLAQLPLPETILRKRPKGLRLGSTMEILVEKKNSGANIPTGTSSSSR